MVLLERCALRLKNDSRRLVRHILFAPDPLVAALRLGWVVLIVWGEIGVFVYALAGCNWPVPGAVRSINNKKVAVHAFFPIANFQTDNWRKVEVTHVLLVADAQLPDPRALLAAHDDSPLGLDYVVELARTVYVRRAWRATRQLRPHVVLFLGDMLKSGRSVRSDDECVFASPPPLRVVHSRTGQIRGVR
jgi:hypothetical protein